MYSGRSFSTQMKAVRRAGNTYFSDCCREIVFMVVVIDIPLGITWLQCGMSIATTMNTAKGHVCV